MLNYGDLWGSWGEFFSDYFCVTSWSFLRFPTMFFFCQFFLSCVVINQTHWSQERSMCLIHNNAAQEELKENMITLEHRTSPKKICTVTLRGRRNEHLTWSKAFCTCRVGLWRVVMAILRLAVETQALSADDALDEPLRRHQRDFLWCHIFLYQWWTGTVCHHDVILSGRNVCRRREEQTVINKVPAGTTWTSRGAVCTWTVLVGLELSDRRASAQCDQLHPQLHRLLKHQQDPQSLERAAAGMPDWRW